MSRPLVVLDADVLGRRRTGDETHVLNLLRMLPEAAPDLRFAAVTRHPELVPEGVEAVALPARSQELRMALRLPSLLRRLRPALVHGNYVLPPRLPCPAVLTVHDVSFLREPALMGRRDRLLFRTLVPRSIRRSRRVLVPTERTKRDLIELVGVAPGRVAVTPLGIDPAFHPGDGAPGRYALFVGAVQARKDPLAALEAARVAGLPLVVVGPAKDAALAEELRRRGADVRGYVPMDELVRLYRGAACVVLPSRYEGFGLPVVEAMASGTPVVATDEPALREVAGDAAVLSQPGRLADGIRRALAERPALRAAGLERARRFGWAETARRVATVYREALGVTVSAVVVSHGHAQELEQSLPALASQVDELVVVANVPGSVEAVPPGVRVVENERPLGFAANANRGIALASGGLVVVANPDAVPEDGAVAALAGFMLAHPRCGVAGPCLLYPDGRWQPSRRRFPTVWGTLVRRTPLRAVLRPLERQRRHYLLDERPAEPVHADWMLGAFLLLRRELVEELGGFDAGFRLYGEDIDLCYRAAKAGWERWYVPAAVVRHAWRRESDERLLSVRTLWHWRGIARFVRKHPERLRALR